jgi:hypothetical protein
MKTRKKESSDQLQANNNTLQRLRPLWPVGGGDSAHG